MLKGTVLVTGGAGYIGAHTIISLLDSSYDVVVVDNFSNSQHESLERVKVICELENSSPRLKVHDIDITNEAILERIFKENLPFSCCIHFAGLKSVTESISDPIRYYENNVGGTLILLKLMQRYHCNRIIFSSSATVYGTAPAPVNETYNIQGSSITNPYGRSKYIVEEMLKDIVNSKIGSSRPFQAMVLRYFNPGGAHPSGFIGEDPIGVPNNLLPYLAQVLVGRLPHLTIYGNDYSTRDGTCIRDFIHVMDLAEGHVAALRFLEKTITNHDFHIFNLGTGTGCSVLELVHAMEIASGQSIPCIVGAQRQGDIAVSIADPQLANTILGWKAKRDLVTMCKDLWNWQSQNPTGYTNNGDSLR